MRRPLACKPWEAGQVFWRNITTVCPLLTQFSDHTGLPLSETGPCILKISGLPCHDRHHAPRSAASHLHPLPERQHIPFCSFGKNPWDFRQQQDVPQSTRRDWSLTGMDGGSWEGQARVQLRKAALEPWHRRQGHRSFSPRFGEGQKSTSESRMEQLAN